MEEAIFSLIYIAISLLLAAVDISLAVKSLRKNCKIGTYLGGACIGAAVVDISYLASILLDDYFRASVMSSIYFASIDWTLVCLLVFTRYFTKHPMNKKDRIIMKLILAYMVFDTIIFLINPFKEIAIKYEYRGTMIAKYKYHMMPLYQMHLAFSYFILILVFVLLIYKITKIPTDYRRQYRYTLWVLLAAVIINAVFLFLPGSSIINLLDYSICAYSIMAAFFYWNCFNYSTHGMLNHFRNLIFENIDQGIALFDYEYHLILYNQRITRLLPGVPLETEMSLQDFMVKCGFSSNIEVDKLGDNYTLQCYTNKGTKMNPIRCDYRLLKNKKNEMMGHLFVLSDASLETDVLTGFQDWESFRMFISENPDNFGYPTTVVICDINNLSSINNSFGHSRGDQAIQMLAEKLRKFLPENSYFVRGQNANLIALCYHFEEQEVLERLDAMQKEYQWNIQYAVSMATKENPDILQAIDRASQGMRTKKLLNRKSGHSDFLTSLVCALQECDSDTEAHVKRTQNMGAMLGKRLGLSDVQLSNLSLLCLLHDIGKIGIPLEILNKPGKLSDTEWRVMKSHVEKGYQIANSASTHAVKNIVSAETQKAQARLQHWENIYRQDPLTGLMNHTAFQNDVEERMLQANTKTVLLMMDIDHFKEYNDTLGHRAGDEFLVLVAQTLSASLDKDSMACRMGGDEFAAAMFFEKNQPDSDIYSAVKNVFEKVNMTVTSSEGGTTLSMGMAVSDEEHNSFNRLYEAADQALYKSKESGRSKLSFYEQ